MTLASNSASGGMYGSTFTLSRRTGPTSRMTFGVWVPGASCCVVPPACFSPFVWAIRFENAPDPTSATNAPNRQSTDAIKTRRLKKADFEVDFLFMVQVELFLRVVNSRHAIKE